MGRGDTERPAFPAGEEQGKSTPLGGRTQPAVVGLLGALPGDDFKRGCIPGAIHLGSHPRSAPPRASAERHAEEGSGTASSPPPKRSQEEPLLEGCRLLFPPPTAPTQWSWKRNS